MALSGPVKQVRTGPRDADMWAMRVCYDHLAGPMAVHMAERMQGKGWLGDGFALTPDGRRALDRFGIDVAAMEKLKRPLVRPCLDWSERRDHIAGALGAGLLKELVAKGWMRRDEGSRTMRFVGNGQAGFEAWLR